MTNPLGTDQVAQVALVVHDIETSKKAWAAFLGHEVPDTIDAGEYETTQTVYRGEPSPKAGCLMAFFDVGPGLQIELIQPNHAPSNWREHLDAHGESVHHLAFNVEDTSAKLTAAEKMFGWPTIQRGYYGDASGEYAYIDSKTDLGVVIETLERF